MVENIALKRYDTSILIVIYLTKIRNLGQQTFEFRILKISKYLSKILSLNLSLLVTKLSPMSLSRGFVTNIDLVDTALNQVLTIIHTVD